MTTALDFPVPTSFTLVRQAGSDQLVRFDGGEHHRLQGPCIVSASFSGPQKAELWLHQNTGAVWKWRQLPEFNGGGERLSGSGQNPENPWSFTSVLLRLHRTWRKITEVRSLYTRSISSSAPRRGGGVDGGRIRRHAAYSVIRGGVRRCRCRPLRREHLSALAGGGVDAVAVKQNCGSVGLSVHDHVCIEQVLANRSCSGRDAGYSECCGSQRRRSVSEYPRHSRSFSRCGFDYHHLPAGVTSSGGGWRK